MTKFIMWDGTVLEVGDVEPDTVGIAAQRRNTNGEKLFKVPREPIDSTCTRVEDDDAANN